jgi:hypothetical protein
MFQVKKKIQESKMEGERKGLSRSAIDVPCLKIETHTCDVALWLRLTPALLGWTVKACMVGALEEIASGLAGLCGPQHGCIA